VVDTPSTGGLARKLYRVRTPAVCGSKRVDGFAQRLLPRSVQHPVQFVQVHIDTVSLADFMLLPKQFAKALRQRISQNLFDRSIRYIAVGLFASARRLAEEHPSWPSGNRFRGIVPDPRRTSAVVETSEASVVGTGNQPDNNSPPSPEHGRDGAEAFWRGVEGRRYSPGSEARGPLPGVRQTDRRSRRCWFGSWGRPRWRVQFTRLERLRCGACSPRQTLSPRSEFSDR
jgi:hypothetical protein